MQKIDSRSKERDAERDPQIPLPPIVLRRVVARAPGEVELTDVPTRYLGYAACFANTWRVGPSVVAEKFSRRFRYERALSPAWRKRCVALTFGFCFADMAVHTYGVAKRDAASAPRAAVERFLFHVVATGVLPFLAAWLVIIPSREVFFWLKFGLARGPSLAALGCLAMLPMGPDQYIADRIAAMFEVPLGPLLARSAYSTRVFGI